MAQFHFKALETSGRRIEGVLEAADRQDALRQLQAMGRMPVSLRSRDTGSLLSLLQTDLFSDRALSPGQLALFMREFATILEAGATVEQALELMIDAHRGETLGVLGTDILTRVRAGEPLAEAMAAQGRSFPPYVINMIRMGSESGTLETMSARLAAQIEASAALRAKIVSSLTYPVMLVVTAIGTIVLLVTFLVPQFESIFRNAGADLPFLTRMVRGASDALIAHGWLAMAVLGVVALAGLAMAQDPARRRWLDQRLLGMPVIGPFLAKAATAQIARMLSTLLASGMPLARAVEVTAPTISNRVFRDGLSQSLETLKSGKRFSVGLEATPNFPPQFRKMVKVGEESGALEPVLAKLADLFEKEVERAIQRFMALFTPVITLVMGGIVAVIVLSIMLPILNLNTLI